MNVEVYRLATDADLFDLRHAVRERMRQLGFGLVDQTRFLTAVSEIARNVVVYAGSGTAKVLARRDSTNTRLTVTMEDKGPGIGNIEEAMRDGFTTAGGLGLGLPGAKRLVDEFEIESRPGEGTRVTLSKVLAHV